MLSSSVIRDLERQVGPLHVYTRPADLAAYSFDSFGASGERLTPGAIVFPVSTEEVSGVVATCAHHRVAVVPRGAGTGYCNGATSDGGVILNLCRMNRILGVEREGMRLRAEAGVITADVQKRAAATDLYYPPDPGASTTSTIGGNVACNASGMHTPRYGSTADFVSGLQVVLADGRIVELGEGSGGDDLLALMLASEGTLGVVTEVLLRLLPAPAAWQTYAAHFSDVNGAANAVAEIAAAGVVPAALEFLDRSALDAVQAVGGPVPDCAALVLVEVEGTAELVGSDGEAVRTALSRAGAAHVKAADDTAQAKTMWAVRKAVSAAVAKVIIGKVNEDVVVPRDRVAELVERSQQVGDHHELTTVVFGHLGDGNMHVNYLIDPRVEGERERGDAAAAELFEMVLGMGGSITGEHGIGTTKLPYIEQQLGAGTLELMRRIKSTLDPRGILNPGKKIPSIVAKTVASAEPVAAAAH